MEKRNLDPSSKATSKEWGRCVTLSNQDRGGGMPGDQRIEASLPDPGLQNSSGSVSGNIFIVY